jgi:putative oxidoreductase
MIIMYFTIVQFTAAVSRSLRRLRPIGRDLPNGEDTIMTVYPVPARARSRGRAAEITLWVLQVLMAGAFVMAAVTKFSRYPAAVDTFDHIGLGGWFMYFIGTCELAGAFGLLIPALSGPAGLGLTALLTGAILTQLLLFAPTTAITPAAYLVPVAIIAWGRRHRTARLVNHLTGRSRR